MGSLLPCGHRDHLWTSVFSERGCQRQEASTECQRLIRIPSHWIDVIPAWDSGSCRYLASLSIRSVFKFLSYCQVAISVQQETQTLLSPDNSLLRGARKIKWFCIREMPNPSTEAGILGHSCVRLLISWRVNSAHFYTPELLLCPEDLTS